MFPSHDMFLEAEVAYRRERLMAARPRPRTARRGRRTRRLPRMRLRAVPQRGDCVTTRA